MYRLPLICRGKAAGFCRTAARAASDATKPSKDVVKQGADQVVGRQYARPDYFRSFGHPLAALAANPFAAMNAFAEAMDRSLATAFRGESGLRFPRSIQDLESQMSSTLTNTLGIKSLNADIAETASEYTVTVEVPGVPKEAVKVDVDEDDGTITISAERKLESKTAEEPKGEGAAKEAAAKAADAKDEVKWHRIERSYGHISRTLQLPENADFASINAKLDNGVLKISVQKKQPTTPAARRTIDIA